MGKRIIVQARGHGSKTYRSPSHRYYGKISYPPYSEQGEALVKKLINCPGHSAPLVLLKLKDGSEYLNPASLGIREGQKISIGSIGNSSENMAENKEGKTEENIQTENIQSIKVGNILPLATIPDGSNVFNLELEPGDGGKLVRVSGSSARVLRHDNGKVTILMPSKQEKIFSSNSRATIGIIAGHGRLEKPFIKAGKRWHKMKATNRMYPRTSALKMNVVDHPFGSGRGKNIGKPKTAPINAPPGRKVGLMRPDRTGRRKRK